MKRFAALAVCLLIAALVVWFFIDGNAEGIFMNFASVVPAWVIAAILALGVLATIASLYVLAFARNRNDADDTITTNDALRVAAKAVDDARLRAASDEARRPKIETRPTLDDPFPNFANAPMRRQSNNVVDLDAPNKAAEAVVRHLGSEEETQDSSSSVLRHEETLYFQPFVDLGTGEVRYYDVLLKRAEPVGRKPIFDRQLTAASAAQTAAFDRMLIEKTVAISRQVFSTLGAESRLVVRLGAELLRSDAQWKQLKRLLSAQQSFAEGLVFAVDAEVLSLRRDFVRDRIDELFQLGAAIACDGLDVDVESADTEMLVDVECVICDFADAFRTANTPELAKARNRRALAFFQRCNVKICLRGISSEGDAADAIDLMAKHGSGAFFGEPKRLRDPSETEAKAG